MKDWSASNFHSMSSDVEQPLLDNSNGTGWLEARGSSTWVSMGGDHRGTRHTALPMNVAGIGHFVGGNSRDAERSACDATMLNYVSSLIAAMGRC